VNQVHKVHLDSKVREVILELLDLWAQVENQAQEDSLECQDKGAQLVQQDPLVHLVLLDQLGKQVIVGTKEERVLKANLVNLDHRVKKEQKAKQDLMVHLDQLDPPDQLGLGDLLERKEVKVLQDQMEA
jgi:hypothetical protein